MIQQLSGESDMALLDSLQEVSNLVRAAYPNGVPDEDYLPLLFVLAEGMSIRNTRDVVVDFTGCTPTKGYHDTLLALSDVRPDASVVMRVRDSLIELGWDPDED